MISRTNILLGIVIILLLVFGGWLCNSRNHYKQSFEDSKDYISSLKDTLHYSKDSLIASKRSNILNYDLFEKVVSERDDLKKELAKAKVKPKNVSNLTSIVSHIEGKDSIIVRHEKIPCPEFKAIPFVADSQFYYIVGKIDSSSITFNKIDFPDSLTLITSTKHFLFKQNETSISAQHSNKYIRTTSLESFNLREQPKWWEKRWIYAVAGFGAGYFLFKK